MNEKEDEDYQCNEVGEGKQTSGVAVESAEWAGWWRRRKAEAGACGLSFLLRIIPQ